MWGNRLSLIGTTSKSVLSISVKRGASGDGQYVVGGITSDGLLKGINAKAVVLAGRVLINSLGLEAGKSTLGVKLQQVVEGGVEVKKEPIKALSVLDWQDRDGQADELVAASIGALSVLGRKATSKAAGLAGNLEAEVVVGGGIKSIKVRGALSGDVTAGGTIGSIKAGSITGTISQGGAAGLSPAAEILDGVLPRLQGVFA